MIGLQAIQNSARAGADSVFEYVERTAEAVPDGVRWQTLSYQNRPQYAVNVFNGVAGIAYFLADYARRTGDSRAYELALGTCRWCSASARTGRDESLCFGRAGVGMAWLRLALSTPEGGAAASAAGDALARAAAIGERVLAAAPGPVTDFLGGAAGEGVFLVRLWEATRAVRHLGGAVRRGEWLAGMALRDDLGCSWPMAVGAARPWRASGFGHGMAGIGHFLLVLHEATQEPRWAALAGEAAQTLVGQARPDHGGLNWAPTLGADALGAPGQPVRCQWCHGAPGVGLFFAKAYEVLREPGYLRLAEAAGETTFGYGDVRGNPSQCHGLAGNAELFLELYRLTGEHLWLERAHDFAVQALRYRTGTPEGDVWQADDPGYYSQDFLCGAAGVGHFFLRLQDPQHVRMPLL